MGEQSIEASGSSALHFVEEEARLKCEPPHHPITTSPEAAIPALTAQPMADAIVKMGKYIATTINPTVTPRNTIIMGSNSAVKFVTAWSTSSS